MLVLAAAVIASFALYLGMSPATPWGFLLPLVLLAGAAALRGGSIWGAGLSVLLVTVLVASVAWRLYRT